MSYYTVFLRNIFQSDKKQSKFLVVQSEKMILGHMIGEPGEYSICQANMTYREAFDWMAKYAHQISPTSKYLKIQHILDHGTHHTDHWPIPAEPTDGVREPPVFCKIACTYCHGRGDAK